MTTQPPDPDQPAVDPALSGVVTQALDDLAQRLGVPTDAITVTSAAAVTWPDGALGCRQPGMMYPQVLVDGARIVLAHDGRRYSYHSGGRARTPFLCEQPTS